MIFPQIEWIFDIFLVYNEKLVGIYFHSSYEWRFIKLLSFKHFSNFQVEYCFFKFETPKLRPLGKCQHFDRCNLFNQGSTANPVLSGLFKILKHMGASLAQVTAPCPLNGRQEFLNISLYSNFLTILPRGMLLIKYRMYNDDGTIIGMSLLIANTWEVRMWILEFLKGF